MLTFFLIIFFLCFIILAWFRFQLALALLFFLLPAYLIRFRIGPLPTTMLEIMVWVILAVWLINTIRHIRPISPIRPTHITIAIALFLLGATISIITATNLRSALGEWKAFYIEPALLFAVLATSIRPIRPTCPIRPINTTHILFALTLSGLATSLLAIYQHFTGWLVPSAFWENGNSYRVTAWYGFPNGVGLFLAPLIPIALYLLILSVKIIKEKRIMNQELGIMELLLFVVPLFMIPAALFAIIFAKSTGAIIGVAAGIVLLVFTIRPISPIRPIRPINIIRLIILAGAVIGLVTLLALPTTNPLKQELLAQNRSGQIRISMWREAAQLLRDRTILGAGLASYNERIKPYHTTVNGEGIEIFHHPHNIFLTIWANTGLIGLIGFIGLIIWFYHVGFTLIRKQKTKNTYPLSQKSWNMEHGTWNIVPFLLSSMTVIVVHGLVDSPYIKNDLAIFFWLLLALMYSSYQSYMSYSSYQPTVSHHPPGLT